MKDAALKIKLRKYLFGRWNVKVSDLEVFGLSKEVLSKLLDDLVREGWIVKSYSDDGTLEFDPGSLQGY